VDRASLADWLDRRDWHKAWLEGNRLLFAGQLLIHLRDVERDPQAQAALDQLFAWLDDQVDPSTGLWGTNRGGSLHACMCGGYHQLLLYYFEKRQVNHPRRLIDSVLSLQHEDGGFRPDGGGGACEDVDAADILVNLYKQIDYRRRDIRAALRRCYRLLRTMQNPDGGFAYNRVAEFSHNSIPATRCPAGTSNMFSTWFRVHTIALINQIIELPELQSHALRFSSTFGMGWHRSWEERRVACGGIGPALADVRFQTSRLPARVKRAIRKTRKFAGRVKRRAGSLSFFRASVRGGA
jgi:hypothetical protein